MKAYAVFLDAIGHRPRRPRAVLMCPRKRLNKPGFPSRSPAKEGELWGTRAGGSLADFLGHLVVRALRALGNRPELQAPHEPEDAVRWTDEKSPWWRAALANW